MFVIDISNIFIFSCVLLSSSLSGIVKRMDNNKIFVTERHSNVY